MGFSFLRTGVRNGFGHHHGDLQKLTPSSNARPWAAASSQNLLSPSVMNSLRSPRSAGISKVPGSTSGGLAYGFAMKSSTTSAFSIQPEQQHESGKINEPSAELLADPIFRWATSSAKPMLGSSACRQSMSTADAERMLLEYLELGITKQQQLQQADGPAKQASSDDALLAWTQLETPSVAV